MLFAIIQHLPKKGCQFDPKRWWIDTFCKGTMQGIQQLPVNYSQGKYIQPAVVGHRIHGGAVRIRLSFPSPKCPKTSGLVSDTVDGRNPAPWYWEYPIFMGVSYITGGAGFLPSTLVICPGLWLIVLFDWLWGVDGNQEIPGMIQISNQKTRRLGRNSNLLWQQIFQPPVWVRRVNNI